MLFLCGLYSANIFIIVSNLLIIQSIIRYKHQHAGIALIDDVTPVGEHPVLRIHALCAVLFIVIKSVEVFVILEAAGLLDHVLAVFLRRMHAGSEVKEVKAFRKMFDLRRGLWLCQQMKPCPG